MYIHIACLYNIKLFAEKILKHVCDIKELRRGSTTIRLRTFRLRHIVYDTSPTTHRLQTFCLLLYTRVQDSYTSNFCFSKSLFSSIPTSTYTMIPFINPASTDTIIIQHIISKHCGMTIQLVLSV